MIVTQKKLGELYENTIPWAIPAAFILTIIGLLILALTI